MLTLTVSRKVMININLKTQATIRPIRTKKILKISARKTVEILLQGNLVLTHSEMNLIYLLNKPKGSSMRQLFQKLNSMSPFKLTSFKFLDTPPFSAWIVINTAEELWFLSERIFQILSAVTKPIEKTYIELDFCKRKQLLSCLYNPNKNIMNHLDALRRNLDL